MYITLTTPRLFLRPLTMDDLMTTHAYTGDLELTQYMLFQNAHSLEDTKTFIRSVEAQWQLEQPHEMEFAVCLNGQHIGGVSIELYDNGTDAELGWVIARPWQRQGYAEEAARALLQYAAALPGISRVIAHCDTRNLPSAALMKRLGMKFIEESDREYTDARGSAREYMFALDIDAADPSCISLT